MESKSSDIKSAPVTTHKEFLLCLSYTISCFLTIYAYQLYLLVPDGEWSKAGFFDLAPSVPLVLALLLSPMGRSPFPSKIACWINRLPGLLAIALGPVLMCVLFVPPIAAVILLINFDNPYAYDIGSGITALVVGFGVIAIIGEVIILLFPKLLGESAHALESQENLSNDFKYNVSMGALASFMLASLLIFALDRQGIFSEYSDLYGFMALVSFMLVVVYLARATSAEPPKSFKYLGKFKAAIIGEMLWYVSMLLTYGGAKLCQMLF